MQRLEALALERLNKIWTLAPPASCVTLNKSRIYQCFGFLVYKMEPTELLKGFNEIVFESTEHSRT